MTSRHFGVHLCNRSPMQAGVVSTRSKRIYCISPGAYMGKLMMAILDTRNKAIRVHSPMECLLETVERYERFCANGARKPPGLPRGPTLMGHCLWPGAKRLLELWPTSTEVNNHSLLSYVCAGLFDINLIFIPYRLSALALYSVYGYY